jgi:hypothetical protein
MPTTVLICAIADQHLQTLSEKLNLTDDQCAPKLRRRNLDAAFCICFQQCHSVLLGAARYPFPIFYKYIREYLVLALLTKEGYRGACCRSITIDLVRR